MDRTWLVKELQTGNLNDRYILEVEEREKSRIFTRVGNGACIGWFSESEGVVIDYSDLYARPDVLTSALTFRAELARRRIIFREEPDRNEVKKILLQRARDYRSKANEYDSLAHQLTRD